MKTFFYFKTLFSTPPPPPPPKDSETSFFVIERQEEVSLSLYENDYSDLIIMEEGEERVLNKEEWMRVIKEKSLKGVKHRDLYASLQFGISFVM